MKITIKTNIEVDGGDELERLGDTVLVTVVAEYAASIAPRIQAGETDAVTIISVMDDDGVEHEPTKAEMERIERRSLTRFWNCRMMVRMLSMSMSEESWRYFFTFSKTSGILFER